MTNKTQPLLPLFVATKVPKDWVTGPVFPPRKQSKSRTVVIKDRKYDIGGFNPLDEDDETIPALDIPHGKACFNILSFYDYDEEDREHKAKFSINEFYRKYANSNGGRYWGLLRICATCCQLLR